VARIEWAPHISYSMSLGCAQRLITEKVAGESPGWTTEPARLRTVIFDSQLLKFCRSYSAHLQPDQDTIAYLFFGGGQAKFRYPSVTAPA
jgi:hypothetical protein